jgi:dihydrofolate synthase/folylpolyglutamate synthase
VKTFAAQHGLYRESYPSVVEAYRAAKEAATLKDFIFIGGSSYLVGDFLKKCI